MGAMHNVLWCCGVMVFWFYGFMELRSHDVMCLQIGSSEPFLRQTNSMPLSF